jgi:hypothetical protein
VNLPWIWMGGACVCACVRVGQLEGGERRRERERERLATEDEAWVAYERTAWTARRVNMVSVTLDWLAAGWLRGRRVSGGGGCSRSTRLARPQSCAAETRLGPPARRTL